jgi:Tfp pilus assembly protein PilV
VLFSTVLLVTGLVAVATLLAVTIRAESMARHGAEATRLAQARVDALMKANFDTNPSVQVQSPGTDSLGTNVANYFDTPAPNTIVRWRVQAGPAGTRLLTVRVLVANGTTTMRVIDLGTLLRRW